MLMYKIEFYNKLFCITIDTEGLIQKINLIKEP